jgi:hypothetical protein
VARLLRGYRLQARVVPKYLVVPKPCAPLGLFTNRQAGHEDTGMVEPAALSHTKGPAGLRAGRSVSSGVQSMFSQSTIVAQRTTVPGGERESDWPAAGGASDASVAFVVGGASSLRRVNCSHFWVFFTKEQLVPLELFFGSFNRAWRWRGGSSS